LVPKLEPEPVIDTEPPDDQEGGVIPGFPIGAIIMGASIGYVVLYSLRELN
jgi:hypothetical protein